MKSLTSRRSARTALGRCNAVVVAVSLTLLAACGDGGDDADSTTAAGADLAGSPIVIGAMIDQSSPTSSTDGPTAEVLEAWAGHVNENGGISGHPVELRIEDTRGDAPEATRIAQEFIDDPSVVAVLMASSGTEGAIGELFAAADLPVSGVGYNPRVWSALPNFYTVTTTIPATVAMQAASAADVGADTIAVAACSENPNCAAAIPILEKAAAGAGLEYSGTLLVSASAPNYTAECLQLVEDGVNYAQMSVSAETSGRLVSDCQRQGYEGWFGASAGSVTPGLYAETPEIRMAGGLNGFPWWVDAEPVQEFRDAMEAQGVEESTYGSPHATGMWAAAELLRTALSGITEDEDVTRATVQDGYGTIQGEDLGGLLPQEISYTPGQPAPPVSCYWLYTYEDGDFVGAEQPSCMESGS